MGFGNTKLFLVILLFVSIVQIFVGIALAAPSVEVIPSKMNVEKGDVFQIQIKISTTESLNNIIIDPIPPEGFVMKRIPSEGIETTLDKSQIQINHLEAGSEQTVAFIVYSPSIFSGINTSQPEGRTLKEPKSFVFNVFYNESRKDTNNSEIAIQRVKTTKIDIKYTTDLIIYLISGLLGILIGYIIKISTKYREDLEKNLMNVTSLKVALPKILKYLFITRLTELLTILVIGLGALLVLAQESVPVNSFDQAISLGIGLAILTDEELLSKLKA